MTITAGGGPGLAGGTRLPGRPRILDAFCGEGGTGAGLRRAGFHVTGVDHVRRDSYAGDVFVQADAIAYIREHGHEFDAIAAAPPCQRYSSMAGRHADREYPDLIPPTREALREVADPAGIPWVIENVPGAPLYGALELCGTHFGLRAVCRDGVERWLRRHRRFEFSPNVWIMAPGGCHCHGRPIGGVYGTGGGGPMTRGYKFHAAEARQAMGIDWMTLPALAQAIPPAYGEYIGDALMETVKAGV